ncbi:MAG: hypothetical protein FKGGLIKP_00202 [Sodalis sp. Fse]|nr:MAG: hypothetical protein FKGGLIKP_00202 [Sodalis sp. Fse]
MLNRYSVRWWDLGQRLYQNQHFNQHLERMLYAIAIPTQTSNGVEGADKQLQKHCYIAGEHEVSVYITISILFVP